jgi:ankyrin repeat protein
VIDDAGVQAIIDGDVERLRARLDAGIDPLAKDRYRGYTLLHVAAQEGEIEAGRALLAAGADPNATDSYGNGPLWTAVFNDNDGRFIELLLAAAADPMHVNRAGRTPVSLARTIGGVTADRFNTYPRGAPHLDAHQ